MRFWKLKAIEPCWPPSAGCRLPAAGSSKSSRPFLPAAVSCAGFCPLFFFLDQLLAARLGGLTVLRVRVLFVCCTHVRFEWDIWRVFVALMNVFFFLNRFLFVKIKSKLFFFYLWLHLFFIFFRIELKEKFSWWEWTKKKRKKFIE